jgi:hypothetical protein
MFRTCKTALAFAAALAMLAAACGGGSSGGNGGGDDTAREISNEELAQMLLAPDQFGPEFAGFTSDPDNTGALNLDTASEDDFDPAAERADLETFGFASGYQAYYTSGEGTEAGTRSLGSDVGIFQTADSAAQYFDDSSAEIKDYIGKTSEGFTIVEAEEFDLETTADEAAGLHAVSRFTSEDGTTTDIWIVGTSFRRGRLLGGVTIYAIGASDLEKQRLEGIATARASALNHRVGAILAAGVATAAPAVAAQGG